MLCPPDLSFSLFYSHHHLSHRLPHILSAMYFSVFRCFADNLVSFANTFHCVRPYFHSFITHTHAHVCPNCAVRNKFNTNSMTVSGPYIVPNKCSSTKHNYNDPSSVAHAYHAQTAVQCPGTFISLRFTVVNIHLTAEPSRRDYLSLM